VDFGSVDTRKWFLGTGLFMAVLFALINAEGSVSANLPVRLAQWLLNVFLALGILIFVHERLNQLTGLSRSRPWVALVISGLAGSLLFSPLALAIDMLFGDTELQASSWPAWLRAWLDELAGAVGSVTLVWLGMNAPAILGLDFDGKRAQAQNRNPEPGKAESTEAATPGEPAPIPPKPEGETPPGDDTQNAFLELLPARIGRDIVWMKSELHYLRVVTTRGKALVLYNLGDAAECMPEEAGIMPHRSYWIAYDQVERLVSTDGRSELVMKDGTRIPLARRRRAEVRRRVIL